jgi:predicted nucleotidyltransferase component of viral defense system
MITTFKTAADFRKSLENRLKNLGIKMDYDLQRLRRTVAFDRLLARILNQDDSSFVLKGGYAMELRLSNARATKDIDLTCLQRLKEGQHSIKDLILDELKMLALRDLGDFFTYQIGDVQTDLDNAPYGGARYPVSSFIDGKLFVRFQLDVGCDAIVSNIETLQGKDWLGFCGIVPPIFKMISVEQQFAEKLHAYTLPRENRTNTRVKDLIDMVLLGKMRLTKGCYGIRK